MNVAVPAVAHLVVAALPAEELGREFTATTFKSVSPLTLSNGVHVVVAAFSPSIISLRRVNRGARALRNIRSGDRARLVGVPFV